MLNKKNFTKQNSDVEMNTEAEVIEFTDDSSTVLRKVKESTNSLRFKEENSTLFSISVDGSKHSEMALDVVSEEFFNQKSRLLLVYVYNDKWNNTYNYKNKKEYVIDSYSNKIMRFGKKVNFIIEDKKSPSTHHLEQVNTTASHFKSNYMICGFAGLKGPKGDNLELSKGISYLLGQTQLPVIIFKDCLKRSSKSSKGYNWLIVLDKQFNTAIRSFEAFVALIDPEKDFVFGLTLIDINSVVGNDEFKDQFMKVIKEREIKHFDYDTAGYSKYTSQIVSDKINYGDVQYDFLVFYNNKEKHRMDVNNSDNANMIMNSNCSICFYNF